MDRVGRRLWRWGVWTDKPVDPGGREQDAEVRLLQFNVCGSACNEGATGDLVDGLRDLIHELDADLVLLNEVCRAQVDRLWERRQDFAGSAAFAATSGVSRCAGIPGRRWYGNAILSRSEGVGVPEVTALSNRRRAVEQRSVLTMRTRLAGTVVLVSVTHLMPRGRGDLNDRQIAEMFAMQSARVDAGDVVVFGGDLNATPARVVAATPEAARFVDIDAAQSAPTLGSRKIDYILLDRRYLRRLDATAQASPLSDHRYLFGRARLYPAGV